MLKVVVLVAAGAVVLAGCAPGRFERSTASFSSSIGGMATALDTSLAALAREETERRDQELVAAGVAPRLSRACLSSTIEGPGGQRLPGCGLVASPTDVPVQSPVWRVRPESLRILTALRDYAKGLEELTSADSRKAVDEAVDAIAVGLGSALTLAGQPGPAAVAAASVKLGGFVYAETLDARRYRQLRRSVQVGQENLPTIGRVLRAAFVAVNEARRDTGIGTGILLGSSIRPGRREYAASVARLSAQAVRVEALQRADPGATVDAMLAAHAALTKALEENEGQTLAVLQAMAEFASRANAMRTAIETANKES